MMSNRIRRQPPPITDRRATRKRRDFLQHIRETRTFDSAGEVEIELTPTRTGRPVTITRLVAAVGLGTSSTIVSDAFQRVIANGWGTPDVGQPYEILRGTASGFSANGTEGVMNGTNGNPGIMSSPGNYVDLDALVTVTTTNLVAAGRLYRLVGRSAAGVETYYCVEGSTSAAAGVDRIQLRRCNASAFTNLSPLVTIPACTVPFLMRLRITGGTIAGTIWNTSEPAAQVTATDLTLTSGGIGCGHELPVNASTAFDNLIATTVGGEVTWDAFLNDPTSLTNLVDSSATPTNRWVPQVVNGQRLEQGEALVIRGSGGSPGSPAVVSGYMLHDA